jgi:phosphoribosylformylglycinamidine cyclo-ligase
MKNSWPELPVFSLLRKISRLPDEELYPVFNMGIGFVICVAETAEKKAKKILEEEGQSVYRIGQIVSGNKTEVCWR